MSPDNQTVLCVLMVEDSPEDCELISRQLARCGYTLTVERVSSEQAMRKALEQVQWDIVLTDHTLPGFCGLAAIELLREMGLPTPVLCVTGSADPNVLRRMLEGGAHACVNKNDLSMLGAAVERALDAPSSPCAGDTGDGMDTEIIDRIYEPFFTTKAPDEDAGLGLAMVRRSVRELESAMAAQSQLGVRTTFDLSFPIHPTMLAEVAEIPPTLPHGNGEHILFVNDEPAICASTQLILLCLGYRVTTQTNPNEALLQFRHCPDQFALVIIDLTMPRIAGLDLAREISHFRPQTPLLLSTGFSHEFGLDRLRECRVYDVIAKPLTPVALAATVHRLLFTAARNGQPLD